MAVFGDLNEVKVIGNITTDIEVRKTPNGSSVCNFSIATNRSYKMGEEWKDEVTFHNIVVWGNDADYLSQKAKKGTKAYVAGRLQNRTWQDNTGVEKRRTEIVAERVILLDRYERSSSDNASESRSSESSSHAAASANDSIDPNDLPF